MGSWRYGRPKQLKKIAYAMTEKKLLKLIKAHEDRGWTKVGDIKPHDYGFGCLLIWGNENHE